MNLAREFLVKSGLFLHFRFSISFLALEQVLERRLRCWRKEQFRYLPFAFFYASRLCKDVNIPAIPVSNFSRELSIWNLSSFDLTTLHLDFFAGYFIQTGRTASPEATFSNTGKCTVLTDLEQFTANILWTWWKLNLACLFINVLNTFYFILQPILGFQLSLTAVNLNENTVEPLITATSLQRPRVFVPYIYSFNPGFRYELSISTNATEGSDNTRGVPSVIMSTRRMKAFTLLVLIPMLLIQL